MTTRTTKQFAVATLFAIATGCSSGKPPTRPVPAKPPMVTAADIEAHPDEPIERTIQRKVTGVVVSRSPDGGIALQIRGVTSFTGTDAPLWMLDDVPFEPGPGGALIGIDPHTIESIKVLKGADAGIYGIRGFNGVIVIKTKKGGTHQ